MTRNNDDRSRLLQILAEAPLIGPACKKAGISRATFYRWQKSNIDFRTEVEKAMKSGRENLIDVAEAGIIALMREKHFNSLKYYLEHNSERYKPMRAAYPMPPINMSDLETYREAMKWLKDHSRLPKHLEDEKMDGFAKAGWLDSEGRPTPQFEEHLKKISNQKWDENLSK